jgi:hypothetical protein
MDSFFAQPGHRISLKMMAFFAAGRTISGTVKWVSQKGVGVEFDIEDHQTTQYVCAHLGVAA